MEKGGSGVAPSGAKNWSEPPASAKMSPAVDDRARREGEGARARQVVRRVEKPENLEQAKKFLALGETMIVKALSSRICDGKKGDELKKYVTMLRAVILSASIKMKE